MVYGNFKTNPVNETTECNPIEFMEHLSLVQKS